MLKGFDCVKNGKFRLKTFISLGCWEDQNLPFDKSNVYYFHCIQNILMNLKRQLIKCLKNLIKTYLI